MVQAFLGRLPMGFKVVILSPHGFFGQQNVLGKPDTGGQVCTTLSCLTAPALIPALSFTCVRPTAC